MSYINRFSLSLIFSAIAFSPNIFADDQLDSTRKSTRPAQIVEMLENLTPQESEELAQYVREIESKQMMSYPQFQEDDVDYKKLFESIEEEETLSDFNKLMRSLDDSIISPIAKIAIALYCLNYYYTKVTPWIKDNFKDNEIVLTKVTEAVMGVWFMEKIKDCAKKFEASVNTTFRGSTN